jgi:hypothetical protein
MLQPLPYHNLLTTTKINHHAASTYGRNDWMALPPALQTDYELEREMRRKITRISLYMFPLLPLGSRTQQSLSTLHSVMTKAQCAPDEQI